MERFKIAINEFEGPLDLMLHLIKEKKLDLFELDLDILADQYIAYINQMQDMHLEIASEYLSELAGLVEYKSKKILPREVVDDLEDDYEQERESLIYRLTEYKKFKEISGVFKELNEERSLHFAKPEETIIDEMRNEMNLNVQYNDGNPYDLIKAMNNCLNRYHSLQPLPIKSTRKELSMEERSIQIKKHLSNLPEMFTLEDLCRDCIDLHMVIVTFLSLLDLIRVGTIYFTAQKDKIYLKRGIN